MDRLYSRLSRTQIISLLAIGIPSVIFLELAEDVWQSEGFWWDSRMTLAIHGLANPWLTQIVRFITFTGGIGSFLIFAISMVWLWRQQRKHQAQLLLVCFMGSALINELLKLFFVRPRPTLFPPLIAVGGYSFPSGHSTAGITLFGVLAIFLWHDRHYGWAIAAAIWGLLIGISRVYLGVHYPSDVLAAWMAGFLWILVTFTVIHWIQFGKMSWEENHE